MLRKLQKRIYNAVYFNHTSIQPVPSYKHIGMYVDPELSFM